MKRFITLAVLVLLNGVSAAYAADSTDATVGALGTDCTRPAALRGAPVTGEQGDAYDFLTKFNP